MFKKKKCQRCKKNVNDKYDFCPSCGNPLNREFEEDFGLLGKNDFMQMGNDLQLPFGFNKIFNSLMKNLSKELSKELSGTEFPQKQNAGIKKNGISIRISTSGNQSPKIKIDSFGNNKPSQKKVVKEIPQKNLSKESLKKFSGLPKKEPKTNLKRFSDKVVYEIEIPGVKSLDDISIMKLENSIEIKALTKDTVYAKIIPINLPITNYNLSKGKLILELGEEAN